MKLACPSCGALMSLDVVVAHDAAREAVQAALNLPAPLGKLMIQYLTLFRPPKRQLTLERVADILCEMLPMITTERIYRNGREHVIAQPVWSAGLREIVERHKATPLKTPLKNHGYLFEILISIATKGASHAPQAQAQSKAVPVPTANRAKRRGEGFQSFQQLAEQMRIGGVAAPDQEQQSDDE